MHAPAPLHANQLNHDDIIASPSQLAAHTSAHDEIIRGQHREAQTAAASSVNHANDAIFLGVLSVLRQRAHNARLALGHHSDGAVAADRMNDDFLPETVTTEFN